MIYTGGTTGLPKGAVWRHGDAFCGCLAGGDPMRLRPGGEGCPPNHAALVTMLHDSTRQGHGGVFFESHWTVKSAVEHVKKCIRTCSPVKKRTHGP